MQEATEVAPTEREVALAKSEMLNSFVFNFASTNTQMQRVAAYALLGIPEVCPTPGSHKDLESYPDLTVILLMIS